MFNNMNYQCFSLVKLTLLLLQIALLCFLILYHFHVNIFDVKASEFHLMHF